MKNKKATSIIEAIVMIFILLIGIIGLFNIYIKSQNLSISTKYKIEAIEIAREGIEAMEVKRNTNWLLLSADSKNCWNSLDYDNDCVGDTSGTYDILPDSYRIYTESNGRWKLDPKLPGLTSKDYSDTSYRNFFRVKKDNNGLYTHNSGIDFLPVFTREIKVSYDTNSNDEKMTVNSIVMWQDNQGNKPHIIDLEVILTNWKK